MSRRLALPTSQVTAICKGAAKAGYIAEVRIGNVFIRLLPEDTVRRENEVDRKIKGYL